MLLLILVVLILVVIHNTQNLTKEPFWSTHQHTNTSTHQHINTPTHQHTNTSTHQHTNTPTHQHSQSLLHLTFHHQTKHEYRIWSNKCGQHVMVLVLFSFQNNHVVFDLDSERIIQWVCPMCIQTLFHSIFGLYLFRLVVLWLMIVPVFDELVEVECPLQSEQVLEGLC